MPCRSRSVKPGRILLECGGGRREVSAERFAQVSEKIRLSPPADGRLLLDDCGPKSALEFLPQFVETRRLSGQVSFSILADLLRLGERFQMAEMLRLLENELLHLAGKRPENMVQALLVAEKAPLAVETAARLVNDAAGKLLGSLARSPGFRLIPPGQMVLILAQCRVKARNELELIDAALLWLSKQPFPDQLAPLVFNVVRTTSLDSCCLFRIMQRLTDLDFTDKTCRYVLIALTSLNGARVCKHEDSTPIRCLGTVIIPLKQQMPLSTPNDGEWIKMKKLV